MIKTAKRILAAAVILLAAAQLAGCGAKKAVYADSGGGTVTQSAYIDIARDEAISILCDVKGDTREKARAALERDGYTVYTCFDAQCYNAAESAYGKDINGAADFGCAVCGLDGRLLAVYSAGGESNHAAQSVNPYSSFKPLSVYAPALEAGKITWSTVFEDTPYKKVMASNGTERDWPANATGTYSMKNETVCEAIKRSLNTAAVKCLAGYGVDSSIAFLTEKLGIELDDEKMKANIYGEEEILGNIAMGYLSKGVSPVDMAGYYQIFANGGLYTKPYAVTKICDSAGTVIFERASEGTRVIKEATAYIMNQLLRCVLESSATGTAAAVDGLDIGGKTGTGDTGDGNWFVGFSPQYCCAVWHGTGMDKNTSPAAFSDILSALGHDTVRFKEYSGVKKLAYCTESGMLLADGCKTLGVGYYTPDNIPNKCNIH